MPGYEGRSRRGLISIDIEHKIVICLLITSHAAGDRERPISAWVVLPLAVEDLLHGHCLEQPSVVANPAFVRLLSFLQPEYKVPSHTRPASLLANRHERAKEEIKCLLRAQLLVSRSPMMGQL